MFGKVIDAVLNSNKIAIFNHTHPDGDALGSAYALKLALLSLGKEAEVFLHEECNTKECALISGMEKSELKIEDCDLKIAVDCADIYRLANLAESFKGNTISIDHHITHVPFAEICVVVPDAPATGEILYDLIVEMGAAITKEIATNLYVAIVCDTGQFKYSSTTAKTHRIAAELIDKGVDIAKVSKHLFETKPFVYLQFLKKVFDKLELYSNGRIALLYLSKEDFDNSDIDENLAGDVVNIPNNIEGVEVGIYIRQRDDGEFKVSLRSNFYADVSKIAEHFGGGGHVRASGFTLTKPIEDVKDSLVEMIEQNL